MLKTHLRPHDDSGQKCMKKSLTAIYFLKTVMHAGPSSPPGQSVTQQEEKQQSNTDMK